MHLKAAHRLFLEKGIPFVSYRLPEASDVITLAGGKFLTENADNDDNTFVFAPFGFDGMHEKLYFKANYSFSGSEIAVEELNVSIDESFVKPVQHPIVASKSEYMNQAGILISEMKKGYVKKVILSRVIKHPLAVIEQHQVFESLCSNYPRAFVYFLSDGKQLRWMGASPEILLFKKNQHYVTMSLAGTKKLLVGESENIDWTSKEIEEQAFVTGFIQDVLKQLNINEFTISGPETVFAGHLAHLKTTFLIPPELVNDEQLINTLHPTPAVCGLPQNDAFELIFKTELHKRSYYTGYLGILKPQNELKLFVNLRCMQLIDDQAYIYVGGGLTAASVPEAEWEETEAKAETLLSVFPNNYATLQHDAR